MASSSQETADQMTTPTDTTETSAPASAATGDTEPKRADRPRIVERAMLMQLGAGLVVRDDIVSSLRKMSRKYGTSAGLEKELNRYEKRGIRTRKRLERQVKRQRSQFERDIRARRKRLESHAATFGKRFEGPAETVGKRLEGPANAVNTKVEGLTGKIENLISSAHDRLS